MKPVTVVGGGIAGLSVAWALARRGRHVTVLEAGRVGGGTSAVATAYLEPRLGTTPARKLEWASLALWPSFAADLEAASGMAVGYRPDGQWRYAFRDDEAAVREDFETRRAGGWDVRWVDADELRQADPAVSDAVVGAAFVAGPAWVDGPAVCRALAEAVARTPGCDVRENAPYDGRGGTLVVANAEGTNGLGLDLPPVRVTKGTTLHYATDIRLTRMLRHKTLSVVPRADGLVVGSSRERGATSLAPDSAIIAELHEKAVRVLPALADVTPRPRCGYRAMIGDGSLNLGRRGEVYHSLSQAGVGYLRAPLVSHELAAIIDGEPPGLVAPFYREAD